MFNVFFMASILPYRMCRMYMAFQYSSAELLVRTCGLGHAGPVCRGPFLIEPNVWRSGLYSSPTHRYHEGVPTRRRRQVFAKA